MLTLRYLVAGALFLPHALGLLSATRKSPFQSAKVAQSTAAPVKRIYETWSWEYEQRTYQINYRVEGSGPPILLVHGFGANLNHFRFQFPALVAAGYKVYAMDLLGFGASEKPRSARSVGFKIELFTQQMIDFMASRTSDEVGENPSWILAGNSIGGLCSLAVAAQPEPAKTVDSVILFNSSGGMTGFRFSDLPVWAHPIMGHTQYFLLGDFHGPFLYKAFASRSNIERVLKQGGIYRDVSNVDEQLMQILLEPSKDEGAKEVFLSVFGGPPGPTRESLLPKVKVPVFALWGSDDPFTPYDDAVKALPDLHGSKDFRLEVVENAGHCLHDEYPDIINEKMLNFLKERAAEKDKAP